MIIISKVLLNITMYIIILNNHITYYFFLFFQGLNKMNVELDLEIYMAILLLPLIIVNYIRNLKFLAPFSTLANVIMFTGFAIILYYIFREPLTFDNRLAFNDVTNFPLFFGTVLFALEAIGVVSNRSRHMNIHFSYKRTLLYKQIDTIINKYKKNKN